MIDDNQSNHCSDPDIDKITKGKVVIFFEILHNHGDKFKIKEKDKNIIKKDFEITIFTTY